MMTAFNVNINMFSVICYSLWISRDSFVITILTEIHYIQELVIQTGTQKCIRLPDVLKSSQSS